MKKISFYTLIGLVALTLGWLMLKRPGADSMHVLILGRPIATEATHLEVDRSGLFSPDSYCIISYDLPASSLVDLLNKPLSGFTKWSPLQETYIGDHFFTPGEMRHTQMSIKSDHKSFSGMLVDLDHNRVYVLDAFLL